MFFNRGKEYQCPVQLGVGSLFPLASAQEVCFSRVSENSDLGIQCRGAAPLLSVENNKINGQPVCK